MCTVRVDNKNMLPCKQFDAQTTRKESNAKGVYSVQETQIFYLVNILGIGVVS